MSWMDRKLQGETQDREEGPPRSMLERYRDQRGRRKQGSATVGKHRRKAEKKKGWVVEEVIVSGCATRIYSISSGSVW